MDNLEKRVMAFIEPKNDGELNRREWTHFGVTLVFAGLSVSVSPWFMIPAILGAIGHRMIVDDQMRRGSRRSTLERVREEVEALVVAAVNRRFDADGMDRFERDLRFTIESLYLQRVEGDSVRVRSDVIRDDGVRYRVQAFVPPEGSVMEPSIEVHPVMGKER